ncbi:MAG TPA: hypothetical protein VIU12_07220 [Chryseolinea sp.]
MRAIVLVAVFATLRFLLLTPLHAQLLKKMHPSGFARLTISVIHEDSSPVVEAKVGVGFNQTKNYWRDGHKFDTKEFVTDAAGTVVASGETTTGWITYGASKDGYYRTFGEQLMLKRRGDRYEPWDLVKELVLKPIIKPIPMYARRLDTIRLPTVGRPVGFDLIASDWVAPYGKGTTSDLIFLLNTNYTSIEHAFDATLTIRFANEGDGIQSVLAPINFGSKLRLPRYAPEEGYQSMLVKSYFRKAPNAQIHRDYRDDQNFFFRVRTVKQNGKVVSAYYGKIAGDIEFWGNQKLRFIYYVNPTPNDRNLEFDPKKNLFSALPELEIVTDP